MPIPQEILSVKRPSSTVVKHRGNKYYVIKRTSVRVKGRSVPKDLGIIGEIVNGKFLKRQSKLEKGTADIKDFGNIAVCDYFGKGLLLELNEVYDCDDACKLYAYALLQCAYGDVTSRDIQLRYETSFVSEFYPGVPCSRKTIGDFLDLCGRNISKMTQFMNNRLSKVGLDSHIIIDGMLKNNNSFTNSFSEFSRKGRIKGSKDTSILYAYDYTREEPLCEAAYPGNMLDQTSFEDFLSRFNMHKGVLVGDKGFLLTDELRKKIAEELKLKYLIPLKRNVKVIAKYEMLNFDDVIQTQDSTILCKKTFCENRYYYAFKNIQMSGKEACGFLQKESAKRKNAAKKIFASFNKKQESFGTIVFESNMDVSPEEIYNMYRHRWDIEEVFRFYKNILDIDDVKVQHDTSLYGVEFINFLSTIIMCRMKNYFNKKNLYKEYSTKQIMTYLSKIKKAKSQLSDDKWCNSKTVKYIEELVKKIDLEVLSV